VSGRQQWYRIATDVGGTFTDLVLEGDEIAGRRLYKRPTTPDDPIVGLLDAVEVAATDLGVSPTELLMRTEIFIHGTTRATNAVVMQRTARTALLCTQGHPDTLLWREGGGRRAPLDYSQEFPDPYIPRSLTVEIEERIGWDGTVLAELNETAARQAVRALAGKGVEAIAVCLLWSIANPSHELRLGRIVSEELDGVPCTLSHLLNPTIREYRRASSAAIDASLKPLMSSYLNELADRLADSGFAGQLFILTSGGGLLDVDEIAAAPIHTIGSGPSAAPVAGLHYSRLDARTDTAIVADAGGTTFDISLLRRGQLPWTRETRVGDFPGYITGFPSVDVRSIGAGGGSIASVDDEGLLHVGPASAGAIPGPAAYGLGGTDATVTDSCVLLGYIDPEYFLGGDMALRADLAEAAVGAVAMRLGLDVRAAAAAIYELAIERMTLGIEDITVSQGIDPRGSVLIAGGGGGGLYGAAIASSLGIPTVIVPEAAPALSATGALLSDLKRTRAKLGFMRTTQFSAARAEAILAELRAECRAFIERSGRIGSIGFSVEARYENQHWEIEVPLPDDGFAGTNALETFVSDFHHRHRELFAHADEASTPEIITWRAEARVAIRNGGADVPAIVRDRGDRRMGIAFFPGFGACNVSVCNWQSLALGETVEGPTLIEARTTTVVVPPQAVATRAASGSLVLDIASRG
jgi:N-methylhydantoinase A